MLTLTSVTFSYADGIRDQYSSKKEACMANNFAYRKTQGYRKGGGQIGWEIESGWRPILYNERFRSEHKTYNTNMYAYVQVVCGTDTLDDCEIVAWECNGRVVGNQCPEPILKGVSHVNNVAVMPIFGSSTQTIRLTVVVGTTVETLVEYDIVETIPFKANSFVGYVDTDGDGYEDTLRPLVLHVDTSSPSYKAENNLQIDRQMLRSALNTINNAGSEFTFSFAFDIPENATEGAWLNSEQSIRLFQSNGTNDYIVAPTIPGANILAPLDCSSLFYFLKKLTALNLDNFDTSNSTNMCSMFNYCIALSSLTLGNFDMQKVTDTSDLFANCYSLNTLNFMALPCLKDQTFNTKFVGNEVTVSYELNDQSVVYSGTNYLPAATNKPIYRRNMAATSNWGALTLPFEAKSDKNIQLYELTSVDDKKMTFSPVETVAANTPCVFKKLVDNATSLTFTATSAVAPAADTPATPTAVNGIVIRGTYTKLTEQTGMYFIALNKFWKADAAITINPFRSWFEGTIEGNKDVKSFEIVVEDENNNTTSINNMQLDNSVTRSKYLEAGRIILLKNGKKYNISGMRAK